MSRRQVLLGSALAVVSLIVGACTDTGTRGDDGFCDEAADFVADRSVTQAANFSAEFFATVDDRLAGLIEAAPDQLVVHLETLQQGFAHTDQALSRFDYDLNDPGLASALAQVDDDGMLDATSTIQLFLTEECGIDQSGGTDPDEVEAIMAAFGVDRALAECLNLELGDVARVPSQDLTPELMTRSVCGTSLFGLLTGTPPGLDPAPGEDPAP